MLKGMNRYLLTADGNNKRSLQLRADAGSTTLRSEKSNPDSIFAPSGGGQRSQGSGKVVSDDRFNKRIMDDFINFQSDDVMRTIARDMLFHDPISGTAVEMLAHLPFSEFEVSAASHEQTEKYTGSFNAMHMRDMLPEIAQETMAEGKHLSMMNFHEEKKQYTGIIPFDPAVCDLTYLPVYGRDPVVNVRVSKHLKDLVNSQDERVRNEIENYADDVKQMIAGGQAFPVPPEHLLYVANRAFSYMPEGVSVFRRIAAVWLYEKNLARGTMDMSSRQQKALIHAVMGDDEFIPTNQQLAEAGKLITEAQRNPVGAMIVTRPGLDINEVLGNGSDIWRWDEAYDFFTTTKLRGLGLSDSIYGDFSVQEAENTLSSVIEKLSDIRSNITNRVLIQRAGLTIAVKNDFKRSQKELTSSTDRHGKHIGLVSRQFHTLLGDDGDNYVNPRDYVLPKIRYTKVLRLVSNSQLFENLNSLDAKMPIPLRILASALGQSVDEITSYYEENLQLLETIADYKKRAAQFAPPAEGEGGDGGDGGGGNDDGGLFASMRDKTKPKNRNFDHIEVRDPHTGKVLSRKGEMLWNERKNKLVLEAATRVRDRHAHMDKQQKDQDRGERKRHVYHSR